MSIRAHRSIGALTIAAALMIACGGAAAGAEWQPDPPSYDVGIDHNVGVVMSDGTRLRADVRYPIDRATGKRAAGPFPVLLTQNPYGRALNENAPAGFGGSTPYFVARGFIHATVDIRGSGGSQGVFGLLDPVQARDGAELVDWAAALPSANGRVGMIGASYLGIIQLLTAAEIGPGSPLQAIFPLIAVNDVYRDLAFSGGVVNGESDAGLLAFIAALNIGNPVLDNRGPTDLLALEIERAASVSALQLGILLDVSSDGDRAYAEDYWRARSPASVLDRIVANGIPAFLVGGWDDVFQRGELMNFAALQNAWAGQALSGPMSPQQPVTSRYQLLMGPWDHLEAGAGVDLNAIALRWFDTWLRDRATGMAETTTPLHLYQLGADRWFDTTHYPLVEATPTRYSLGEGGTLTKTRPASPTGADTILFTGATSPCNRATSQWSVGVQGEVYRGLGQPDPCTQDDSTIQIGPGALTYTTAPLEEPAVLAGPVGVTVFATATASDTLWVVTLEDVSPSGTSTPLTSGALLGSFRALDAERSWITADGAMLQPYHPYTRASVVPVTPGEVTRYDIEVFPTVAELATGHRLRLTLDTGDTPHLLPTPAQVARLAGGVYEVQRNANASSFVTLPLAPASAFPLPCVLCAATN
jgi:uncharacterized protein